MTHVIAEMAPVTQAEARARSRVRYNQWMKLARRIHLYAGLFMTPWVFLYGVTSLLFNHPSLFSDQSATVRKIAPENLAGTALADFPKPADLAAKVVEAINASAKLADGESEGEERPRTTYQLVHPEEAVYPREYTTTLTGDGIDHMVRLDLATGSGSIRSSARRAEPARGNPRESAPFAGRVKLKLEKTPLERLNTSLLKLLSQMGLKGELRPASGEGGRGGREGGRAFDGGGEFDGGFEGMGGGRMGGGGGMGGARGGRPGGPQGAPGLTFLVEGGGKTWRASYNLQTSTLSGRPMDETLPAGELSTRRFLTRLHTSHGYSSGIDARSAWAISVDLMALSMVGWGITGLLMWWQMKNVRNVGAVVLVASVVVSAFVAVAMHASIVAQ